MIHLYIMYDHANGPPLRSRDLFHRLVKDNIHEGVVATENTRNLSIRIQLKLQPLIHKSTGI